MNKIRLVVASLLLGAATGFAQKSFNASGTGNPIIPGYFADPTVKKFGDTYYRTLAMNLAYNGHSAIPVKFVFQLAAPTYFAPSEWSLLMKVDRLDSEEEFCKMMTGKELEDYDTELQNISPACIVNEDSVPSLIGYGLIDHCVPLSQKYYLMEAYDRDNVMYDYIEFPKSNHGMYNDLDKLQEFLDKSLEYARVYFTD